MAISTAAILTVNLASICYVWIISSSPCYRRCECSTCPINIYKAFWVFLYTSAIYTPDRCREWTSRIYQSASVGHVVDLGIKFRPFKYIANDWTLDAHSITNASVRSSTWANLQHLSWKSLCFCCGKLITISLRGNTLFLRHAEVTASSARWSFCKTRAISTGERSHCVDASVLNDVTILDSVDVVKRGWTSLVKEWFIRSVG